MRNEYPVEYIRTAFSPSLMASRSRRLFACDRPVVIAIKSCCSEADLSLLMRLREWASHWVFHQHPPRLLQRSACNYYTVANFNSDRGTDFT